MKQPFEEVKITYYSVAAIAERWALSTDKVSRVLEAYRDDPGYKDFGSPGDTRRHTRKYSIVRIHPTLLAKIEAAL
jgi:hypothetical protein